MASGAVGLPVGTAWLTIPNNVPTVTTAASIGAYVKVFQSQHGTYRAAAKAAVDDLLAWIAANRDALGAAAK